MRARSMLAGMLLLWTPAYAAPALEPTAVTDGAVALDWSRELEERVLALAAPELQLPGPAEPQGSPRYASHEVASLEATQVGCGWVIPTATPRDRALLELAGALLAGRSDSVLARQLVDRSLARAVEARWIEHGERTLFAIFVLGSIEGQRADIGQIVDDAVVAFSVSGPTAAELEVALRSSVGPANVTREDVRSAVARHLSALRRSVVELVPRNAADPALSVKLRSERARSNETQNRSAGRPKPGSLRKERASGHGVALQTVERGDTLTAIARRYKIGVNELASKNGIDPAQPIRIGQKLVVPSRAPSVRTPRSRSGSIANSKKKTTPVRLRNRPSPRSS